MIQADGLQLHFNIPQELAMREGDRDFRGILENVARIVENCPVPVIAKEVGFGFSREAVEKLYAVGIRLFDNGGSGGTNFLAIEDQRDGQFDRQMDYWGIPTAASLAEIVSLQLPIQIVASGGIRTAHDIAKAIAMGADMVGITGLFLKILINEGPEELVRRIEKLLYQLQSVFLMSGARDWRHLRNKPVLILAKTAEWLRAREIDPKEWSNKPH
jgi:isopentenyl-diphosphate delta-isomerase